TGCNFSPVRAQSGPICAPVAIFPQSVRRADLFAHRRRNERPPAAKAKRCAELDGRLAPRFAFAECDYATWVSVNKITFHGRMPLKVV
ncbi:MAG: hypothetical protein ACI3ZI_05350, partial [Candidatus Cryptobacteroides sp.]